MSPSWATRRPSPRKRLLSTGEVAELLGCGPRAVVSLADQGYLPVIRLTPRSWRKFDRLDVERLIDAGRAIEAVRELEEVA